MWVCQCDCGNIAFAQTSDLRAGRHRSCGCLRVDVMTRHGGTNHGGGRTPEYRSWMSMKARCLDSDHDSYKWYGGRGITICDRWLASFEAFLADMGARPSLKHSIDRINNDGNYEPGNCRWATANEQAQNQRHNNQHTRA